MGRMFVMSLIFAGLFFPLACGPKSPSSPGSSASATATISDTPSPTVISTSTVTYTPTSTSTSTDTPTVTSTPTQMGTPTSTGTPAVTYVTGWSATDPQGIAVDPTNGHIVVTTGWDNCLEIFDSSGSPVTTACMPGSMDGQFNGMGGVAVDQSGNIYVVDSGNNRVEVLNASLTPVNHWGGTGSGPGQFNHPTGIVLDNGGAAGASVYVVDRDNQRVQKFTQGGSYVTSWGGFTFNAGTSGPTNIAVDSTNHIYVVSVFPSTLYKFDSDGTPVTQWYEREYYIPGSSDAIYKGLAVGPSGDIYIACGSSPGPPPGSLRRLDSSGNYLGEIDTLGPGGPALGIPVQVAVDGSGTLFMSDILSNRIDVFSP